jgi:glycerate kinase
MGKAPIGVAQLAKRHAKPVIAFSGCVTPDARLCNEHGIDAFFPILRQVTTMSQAMEPANARQNMIDTVEQVFRLLKTSSISPQKALDFE